MINIVKAIVPEIKPYTTAGQKVELVGSDKFKHGVVFTQQKPSGKTYVVSLNVQFNSATGLPYAANLQASGGGQSGRSKLFKEINLSKIEFYDVKNHKVKVSNSGKQID